MYIIMLLIVLFVVCALSLVVLEHFRGSGSSGSGSSGSGSSGSPGSRGSGSSGSRGGHRGGYGGGGGGHGGGMHGGHRSHRGGTAYRSSGGSSYGGWWGYGYPFVWWGYPYYSWYNDTLRCDKNIDCGSGYCDEFGYCAAIPYIKYTTL